MNRSILSRDTAVIPTDVPGLLLAPEVPADAREVYELAWTNADYLSAAGEEWYKDLPSLEATRKVIELSASNIIGQRYTIRLNGRMVGGIDYNGAPISGRSEIGYYIDEDHAGNGFATASVAGLAGYLKAKAAPEPLAVFATVAAGNKPSRKVLERVGFSQKPMPGIPFPKIYYEI